MKADAVIAGFLFFAASAVAVAAYRAVGRVERPQQDLLQELKVGKREHLITQGTDCIGKFVTNFQVKPEVTLISNGEIRFRYQDQPIAAKIFVGSFFNMLNQLVAMNLSLETEKGKIEVNLSNTAPINVLFKLDLDGRHLEKNFTVPGPVLLQKNSTGTYRVDLSAIQALTGGYTQPFRGLPIQQLDFAFVEQPENGTLCASSEQQKAFILDPIADQVLTFVTQWQNSGLLQQGL